MSEHVTLAGEMDQYCYGGDSHARWHTCAKCHQVHMPRTMSSEFEPAVVAGHVRCPGLSPSPPPAQQRMACGVVNVDSLAF